MQMNSCCLNPKTLKVFLLSLLFFCFSPRLPAQCAFRIEYLDGGGKLYHFEEKTGLIGKFRKSYVYADVTAISIGKDIPCLLITIMPGILDSYRELTVKSYAVIETDSNKAVFVRVFNITGSDDSGQLKLFLFLKNEELGNFLGNEDIRILIFTEEERFTLMATDLKKSIFPCLYSFSLNTNRY